MKAASTLAASTLRERAARLARESQRRRRETALTILFTATTLLRSRLHLRRVRRATA